MAEEKKIYLSQRDLFNEIVRSRVNGVISNKLGEMFMKLSSKVANHYKFVRYIHIREDLIAAGAVACCKAFEKFHPFKDKSIPWEEDVLLEFDYTIHANAFAYLTSSIWNAFLQVLKREYAFTNVVNASRVEEGLDASFGYTEMIHDQEEEMRAQRDEESDIIEIAPHLANEKLWDDGIIDHMLEPCEDELFNGIEW